MNPTQTEHYPAQHWHELENQRIQCDLCPRYCQLNTGQRGFCFIRKNVRGKMVLTSYGRSSGFAIDPIEKKPLNHFYPGSTVLSFGTAGCNLGCKFCQNWDISKSRRMESHSARASAMEIVHTAQQHQCASVAFTYNDPIIFYEYAMDVAQACQQHGVKTVAVTAAYISPQAWDFFTHMNAANVDLKSFDEKFYRQLTGSHLQPVLDTLQYIYHQTQTWLEITTLLIPGYNDSELELHLLSQWLVDNLGPEVPLHFSAFHPDYKMMNIPPTPVSTLRKARQIAKDNGLQHVYTGNVHDKDSASTYCSQCRRLLIGRDWYQLYEWYLDARGCCQFCGHPLAGHFV